MNRRGLDGREIEGSSYMEFSGLGKQKEIMLGMW